MLVPGMKSINAHIQDENKRTTTTIEKPEYLDEVKGQTYDYSNPLVLKLPAAHEFLSLDGNNMPLEIFQNNVLNSVDFFYKDHLYQEIKHNF